MNGFLITALTKYELFYFSEVSTLSQMFLLWGNKNVCTRSYYLVREKCDEKYEFIMRLLIFWKICGKFKMSFENLEKTGLFHKKKI